MESNVKGSSTFLSSFLDNPFSCLWHNSADNMRHAYSVKPDEHWHLLAVVFFRGLLLAHLSFFISLYISSLSFCFQQLWLLLSLSYCFQLPLVLSCAIHLYTVSPCICDFVFRVILLQLIFQVCCFYCVMDFFPL